MGKNNKKFSGLKNWVSISTFLISLIFFLVLISPGFAQPASNSEKLVLMPYPEKLQLKEGQFRLDEKFYAGGKAEYQSRTFKAIARFMFRLSGRTGLFFEQDFLTDQQINNQTKFLYQFNRPGLLVPNEDESYFLEITPEKISLRAETDLGILRGLETLLQLLSADSQGYYFPCVRIEDRPRFTWRGLLIDSCRHFMPLEVIKRNLLAMATVKMNVLHWHLSEDQGFRVESKVFPKLQQLGSDGLYYTQEQIKEIIQLASDLGIRVVPEFDIPGHSTSWFVAYPEYASGPGPYRIERKFGVSSPVFDPTEEKTYKFFDQFIKEMANLFPDPYFHIGGDEVDPRQWKENPKIQNFMKKHRLNNEAALQAYFNLKILKILTKYHKKMIGWDEIYQPGLPQDIVIQSWRGTQALIDGAQKGYQGILSNGYYIDLYQSAEKHYLNDPIPVNSPLTAEQKKLILGGEATMWAELVSPENIDSRIWPRTAAIAERLWSPQEIRDVDDLYRRLRLISIQLEEAGATHLKNQPMMLRRLARSYRVKSLEILARISEPIKGYARHSQGKVYTSLTPLTRFVDACYPESLEARDFKKLVEKFIQSRDLRQAEEIKDQLRLWINNHEEICQLAEKSPIVKEIVSLSEKLVNLSRMASEAVDLILENKKADSAWLQNKFKELEEAKKPQAECQIGIIPAVELMLNTLK
ncbi:MAG: beta-N-acetylhexosaminidase [Candidatus Saccharicenans sp.]|nr:MAG: beta-hexosaminidase [Candidatus Aminicenantes bacterium]HEK85650.1 beta-hexosaminidase [Candidatus Aminicenantes bacterium]